MIDEQLMLAHYRDRSGIEVDLVVERADGSVIAIEVKAATSASARDAAGLRFLRDRRGQQLIAGLILHTGPLTAQIEDRIWAVPIAAVWGGESGPVLAADA